ncbi:clathrin light chain [Mrakia frigida]|uniref:clathrin light chain CLC1 n=1 Tax=Mrakia frigida TaxID=29902 RepID=UPI003FCC15D4
MDDFSTDDFLARERAALGGDANLFTSNDAPSSSFDLPSTDFPELGDDDSSAIPSLPPATTNASSSSPTSAGPGFPSIASLAPSAPSRQAEVTITGGDEELDKFESEFPDVAEFMPQDIQSTPAPSSFQYGQSPYAAAAPSASTPSFMQQQDDEPESEAITSWKVKQAEEIKARDEKSKAKREETIVKAEQAIDKFYEDYNAGKERSIKENKENEAAFLADLSASLSQGTTWERIADLVGLENSQSKTLARSTPGGSDLARMKEVLLRLKRQGENAPGAKGY